MEDLRSAMEPWTEEAYAVARLASGSVAGTAARPGADTPATLIESPEQAVAVQVASEPEVASASWGAAQVVAVLAAEVATAS